MTIHACLAENKTAFVSCFFCFLVIKAAVMFGDYCFISHTNKEVHIIGRNKLVDVMSLNYEGLR